MLLAGAVLALQGGAMSSVLKNLEAAQNFLGGMRSLSSYGPLEETQAKGMLRCIEKAQTMAPAQAAAIVHALDVSLWTAASVERFKCALAERTGAVVSAAAGARRSMQDFQNFGEFLTVELGEQVLGRAAATGDVLEKLRPRGAFKLEVSHGVDPPGLCCVPAHMAEMGGMGAGALSGRRPAERPTWT